jgi:hypothetical protein
MPPLEAFVPSIAIGLILFVMLWFALGTQRNIRKGNDVLRWLQGGLPILGRRTTMRWLGSSAVELGIVEAESPFRDATVVIVLEPRDVSFLWAYARSRGRRDFLIVRANLVRPPRYDLDVRDPRGWTGRSASHPSADETEAGIESGHRVLDWPDGCIAVAGPGADQASARTTWRQLTEASDGVWRLTIQPVVPHLEVHLRPPRSETIHADRVLTPIRALATTLAER